MSAFGTTRMSTRGQVVIPENVRRELGLSPGTALVVLGEGDVVILRAISPPSLGDFDRQIAAARREAKRHGLRQPDIQAAVAKVRARRRRQRK